jgi:biopolymer transport protein ExbD
MKKRLHQSHLEEEDNPIDLTPLIDVVFVVLIAFIIIAPMLEIDTIDLASSSTELDTRSSLIQTSPTAVYVRADNSIWIGGEKVPQAHLESRLKNLSIAQKTTKLQLFHDQKASFGTYQMIKNTAEKIGFEELDVILKPS